MNRCYELERSNAAHKKGLGVRINHGSNVTYKGGAAGSKDENIRDGDIPMHYVRARNE